ncbi:MAG: hypothetical protein O9311_08125 [Cytophagales bacterium]|nr:hypothetical protein [Cytophagales bacterium]
MGKSERTIEDLVGNNLKRRDKIMGFDDEEFNSVVGRIGSLLNIIDVCFQIMNLNNKWNHFYSLSYQDDYDVEINSVSDILNELNRVFEYQKTIRNDLFVEAYATLELKSVIRNIEKRKFYTALILLRGSSYRISFLWYYGEEPFTLDVGSQITEENILELLKHFKKAILDEKGKSY